MLKLNLGAGSRPLDGYVNVDRATGGECYPLRGNDPVPDSSADEIRASHILEHWSHRDTAKVLAEWVRVLKPGGVLKVAVPDLSKIVALDGSKSFIEGYIMGGHVDANDHHGAIFTEAKLRRLMSEAGLVDIQPWVSEVADCASLPISLNLQGRKPEAVTAKAPELATLKVAAILSRPRFGLNDFWDSTNQALRPFGIPLRSFKGVFWGQCMQRAFNECVDQGIDWILTLDYDSLITAENISTMFGWLGKRPDIDAISALQCRRGQKFPLMTVGSENRVELDGNPVKVTTSHFGLTVLRVEALKKCAKPWFFGKPDKDGEWGDERLDDDIWFWHQWRLAGNTIYVAPDARIGHMEEMVAVFDDHYEATHVYPSQWRAANGLDSTLTKKVTA